MIMSLVDVQEHRQTMTQHLQALKENQEVRKEYQAEINMLREQLDKALHESGMRRPIRRSKFWQLGLVFFLLGSVLGQDWLMFGIVSAVKDPQ